jgi:hypothetical protein
VGAKAPKIGKAARIPGIGILNIKAIRMPFRMTVELFFVKVGNSRFLNILCCDFSGG